MFYLGKYPVTPIEIAKVSESVLFPWNFTRVTRLCDRFNHTWTGYILWVFFSMSLSDKMLLHFIVSVLKPF